MRTALISDIHGNFDGLLTVLEDIDRRNCDRIVCLGDLVDGGTQSVEVVRYLRDHAILTVRGNHDESTDLDLPPDVRAYLRSLPEEHSEGSVIYTHTSPRTRKTKIRDEIEAWNVFEDTSYTRIFVGDVHIPLLFGYQNVSPVSSTNYSIDYDIDFAFATEDRYIICAGSIGYSRDGDRRLRYAIFDDAHDTVTFCTSSGLMLPFG